VAPADGREAGQRNLRLRLKMTVSGSTTAMAMTDSTSEGSCS
jgi:hypothetical protein